MTVILIVTNLAVFVWSRFLSGAFDAILNTWGFIAATWNSSAISATAVPWPLLTPLTSLFLHGGVLHAVGNLWFLRVFGDNVEDEQGRGRFLFFYLICGLFAVFTQYLYAPDARLPLVGASGAVSGVLAAYVLYHPTAMIHSFVPVVIIMVPVRLPAFLFIGVWAALQFLGGIYAASHTQIAFAAHIGGFIAGIGIGPVFRKRSRRRKR